MSFKRKASYLMSVKWVNSLFFLKGNKKFPLSFSYSTPTSFVFLLEFHKSCSLSKFPVIDTTLKCIIFCQLFLARILLFIEVINKCRRGEKSMFLEVTQPGVSLDWTTSCPCELGKLINFSNLSWLIFKRKTMILNSEHCWMN